MKKVLLAGFVAVLLMEACKKDYTAAFNTSDSKYYMEQTVTFNNTSTGGTFSWDFGDGTKSTDKSPTHAFAQPGDYNVTLTDGGSVATKTITIYHGTSAFHVDNEAGVTFSDIVTLNYDASGYEEGFIDHGSLATGTQSKVYYTTDSTMFVGGLLPGTDSTFLVAPPNYPYSLLKGIINILTINANTRVYVLQSAPGKKISVQDIKNPAIAHKTTMGALLTKHTVQ